MSLVTGARPVPSAGKRVKLSKACYTVYYQHDIFYFGGLVHALHRLLSYVQAPMGNFYSINSLSSQIPISYFYSFLITGVAFCCAHRRSDQCAHREKTEGVS